MATDPRESVEKLEALGVRGILRQLAQHGQIVDVRCEMPQRYCFRGLCTLIRDRLGPNGRRLPTTIRGSGHGGHLTPETSGWRIDSATGVTTGGG